MSFRTFKIYKGKVLLQEEFLKELVSLGYSSSLEVTREGEFKTIGELIDVFPVGFDFPVRIEWEWDTVKRIRSFDAQNLIFFEELDIVIFIPRIRTRTVYFNEEIPLTGKLQLKEGDYVVHINYGIGKFKGRKRIDTPQGKRDFFEIEYENNEKLFVPLEKTHLLQKYVSIGRRPPRISKLGGKLWLYTKQRVRRSIRKFALELVRLQASREVLGGFKFSKDTPWQEEFNRTFPYEETEDQKKAFQEVKEDMECGKPMDRLICGDVGYGKTEVALRASFKAVMDSKQVAFLVPTTILAEQHYQLLKRRVKDFPLRVEMLSRFRTPKQQKMIIKNIKKGLVDIVIGTHRLLSSDVEFKDLGLLIIDEEQRFGVRQKERIKKLKMGVEVLTLSATPIPRTLYMSLTGIKSISIIKTPPKERLAVRTIVSEFNQELIREAILREYNRKGQVYFISNRIKHLPKIEKLLKEILPSRIKIGVAHGRMNSHDLEKVMLKFINKEIDCLISTPIVESGIDIPLANTLIVNNAHMFGLADLHQLRGRVGRLNIQAYAYFLIPKGFPLSKEAKKRLEIFKSHSYLGAGFELSMQDLELRGAGNILGEQQHGFIWQIGLDLYCRLLRCEIENIKREFKLN